MNAAINIIASDIGVVRYTEEPGESYAMRTLYSASRYWAEAMCVDDGFDGTLGIAKSTLNKRLTRWISRSEAIVIGSTGWFMSDSGGIPRLYNRLIDMGDIAEVGSAGRVVARKPETIDTGIGCALLVGLHDFGRSTNSALNVEPERLITSGLATIVMEETPRLSMPKPCAWLSDSVCLPWEDIANYDDVEYIDPSSKNWNLYHSGTWRQDPEGFFEGYTLARRSPRIHEPAQFFLAKRLHKGMKIARIHKAWAQELFFALRMSYGNPVMATYWKLDAKHIGLKLPIGFLPGRYSRYVDAFSWPVENIKDNFNRIARVESLYPIVKALRACNVVLKEC